MMTLTIGRRVKAQVANIEEGVKRFAAERDASCEGASTFPEGKIKSGRYVAKVSYNGRVVLDGLEVRPGCEMYTSESL